LAGNGFWLGLGVGPPTEARAGAVRLANGVLPDDAAIRADGVLATPQPLTLNPSAATRASAWPRRRRRADLLPFQFITSHFSLGGSCPFREQPSAYSDL
jgi:hypothetical protein